MALIGGAVGGAVVFALFLGVAGVALAALCLRRRRRKLEDKQQLTAGKTTYSVTQDSELPVELLYIYVILRKLHKNTGFNCECLNCELRGFLSMQLLQSQSALLVYTCMIKNTKCWNASPTVSFATCDQLPACRIQARRIGEWIRSGREPNLCGNSEQVHG